MRMGPSSHYTTPYPPRQTCPGRAQSLLHWRLRGVVQLLGGHPEPHTSNPGKAGIPLQGGPPVHLLLGVCTGKGLCPSAGKWVVRPLPQADAQQPDGPCALGWPALGVPATPSTPIELPTQALPACSACHPPRNFHRAWSTHPVVLSIHHPL